MASPVTPNKLDPRPIQATGTPYDGRFSPTAAQKFPLGTKWEMEDGSGRVFRYAKAGATALAANKMGQASAPVANHTNIAVGTAASIGDTVLTISTTLSTALTADQYAGGWIHINDATGEGQTYRVVSNTAGTTGTVTIEEGLNVALATTSEFTLTANPWNGVIVAPTTKTAPHVGVPSVAVTGAYYYWAQVAGPCGLLVDGGDTLVIGDTAGQPSTWGTAGAVGACAVPGAIWGTVMSVNAATEYALINLNLAMK